MEARPRRAGAPTDPAGHKTRALILKAAVEFASLRGLEQLSLGRLASAVKMSKSGLFAHFGSKEELQLATVKEAWDVFDAEVLRDPAGEHGGGLAALLERWVSFSERKVFPGGCLFLHQAVEFASRSGPVREALANAVARQVQALEERVPTASEPEGHRRGDASKVAFGLHSMVVGADALFRVQEDPAVFDRARAAIRALCSDPGGERAL